MNYSRILMTVLPVLLSGTLSFSAVHPDGESEIITSGNPIITHMRCADPSAEVWPDGQVWVYATHDPDGATDYSTLEDYHVYSSYDLVNWTDHGVILHARDVSWGNSANAWMFAPDAAYSKGTYYLYFPTMDRDWQWRIGVATSDRPEGPFTDVGHYIEGTDHFDPTCFVDDDGTAYLLWGGGGDTPKMARLKENMTELAEAPRPISYGADNFGEGGYLHKRDGIYYFSYTCNTCYPYQAYYAISDHPYGPFEYKGALKRIPPGAQDHHSMIEYHGQWYYFYHVGNYGSGGSLTQRNICIDSMFYNADGTIREVIGTETGVREDLIGSTPGILVPGRLEAEDWFREDGTDSLQSQDPPAIFTRIGNGGWSEYVLEVLGSEDYQVGVQTRQEVAGTQLRLFVDEVPADTLVLDGSSDPALDSLYLPYGKHTLKLLAFHPDSAGALLQIDWMELTGSTDYFPVVARASAGGTISPEGTRYYARGDSAVYRMTADDNFVLKDLIVDSLLQSPSDRYAFYDIAGMHSIEAVFEACEATPYTSWYQVDGAPPESGNEIVLTESSSLRLAVIPEAPCELHWTGPSGFRSDSTIVCFDSITISQQGHYTAILTNEQQCTVEIAFHVVVEYLELDVYQAEDFFSQSGTQTEACSDLGGGWYLDGIGNGDWCYYAVEIDTCGTYELVARVASAGGGGSILVSAGDSGIAVIGVDPDPSRSLDHWFTTDPVAVLLDRSYHYLKFTFSGGDSSLFRFNWFDLTLEQACGGSTAIDAGPSLYSYPNPVITGARIVFTLQEASFIELKILNAGGALLETLIPYGQRSPGSYSVTWNPPEEWAHGREPGLYIILLRCNEKVIPRKILLIPR
jgi:arabinoxylan arabinofuranohydrolase